MMSFVCVCQCRKTGRLPPSTPLRPWQCALLPVIWLGRSWWTLIKVRNDWHVSSTLTSSFISHWNVFEGWPNMQINCLCLSTSQCVCVWVQFLLSDVTAWVFNVFNTDIYLLLNTELHILRHLLGSSCDEMVSGNAALCLAHCLELEGTGSNLLGTDIVLLLLRHAAGDAKMTAVQQNAAIALGKLCRSEPR